MSETSWANWAYGQLPKILPVLRNEREIDLIIAQSENVSDGKGITPADFQRLREAGVDFGSGGNWSMEREEIVPLLNKPDAPIIRPANYPSGTPGLGYKYVPTSKGNVLIVSLVGQVVGRDADKTIENPLKVVDKILASQIDIPRIACVVNFHGDYSSEKVVIGHYLDGRVTAVIGDHWHVPTADARVLPGGTAHMTDVGMCGALDASLGISFDSVLPRWRDGIQTRNVLVETGRRQFNALLVTVSDNGSSRSRRAHTELFGLIWRLYIL